MTATWQQLDWDTDFFGVPIGRLTVEEGVDADAVRAAEGEAREAGLLCLYLSLDPADYQTTYLVQTLGYRFLEASVNFELRADAVVPGASADCLIRAGTVDDLPALDASLVRMAPWSRYAVDPRFGLDAAVRVHRAWIERAARCETGERDLRVAEDGSGIVAFASRNRLPRPMIDTIATTAPGAGAAQALVVDGQRWAAPDPVLGGWIASRNIASTRFVEQCGYRMAEVRYQFHRWLDEADAPGGAGERHRPTTAGAAATVPPSRHAG